MSSARQLLYQFVQGHQEPWYYPFILNMRQLRENEDYWRFIDDKRWAAGPRNLGERFTQEQFLWRVEIGEDNKILLYKEPNNGLPATLAQEYQHNKELLSVDIEFDQTGRQMVIWEDVDNDVFMRWYDPQAAANVTTLITRGITPKLCTTRYYKLIANTGLRTNYLFYIHPDTRLLCYRRQQDRWETEFTLPAAPEDLLELLVVGKNIYGGLTAATCYEDSNGEVHVRTYTAINDLADAVYGEDGQTVERGTFAVELEPNRLAIFDARTTLPAEDSGVFSATAHSNVLELFMPLAEVFAEDSSTFVADATANRLELYLPIVPLNITEPSAFVPTVVKNRLEVYEALLPVDATDEGTFAVSDFRVDTLTLG